AELDHVDDDAHRRHRRTDPFLLRDELLQHVVLDGAAEPLPRNALLLGDRQVHGEQHARRAVDRHRRRHRAEVDALKELARVVDTATPSRPTSPRARGWSASKPMRVGMSKAVESPVCPSPSRKWKRVLVSAAVPNPANWRIVQSRPRYMLG